MPGATTPQARQRSSSAGDVPSTPLATAVFRRSGSGALVEQSFFDSDVPNQRGSVRRRDGAGGSASAAAATASPFPMPPLRTLHGRVRSNTQQDFFDGAGADAREVEVPAPRGSAACQSESSRRCGEVGSSVKPPTVMPSPPPCTDVSEGDALSKNDSNEAAHLRGTGADAASSMAFPRATLGDFTQQYEHSGNPYLRAAAKGVRMSSGSADWTAETKNETEEVAFGATSSSAVKAGSGGHGYTGGARHMQSFSHETTHKPPQLTRPLAHHSSPNATALPEAFAARATHASSYAERSRPARSAPVALRGIPLPTRSRQGSRLSSATSMQESLAEYGRLQLQDEAVHWYHRCSELELTVAQLQETYDRQSKVLAAQWRSRREESVATGVTPPTAAAKFSPDATADKKASTSSPEGPSTALTSRSPDSLSPAYMVECGAGEVIEAGTRGPTEDPPLDSLVASTFGAALEGKASERTHYVVPRPQATASASLPIVATEATTSETHLAACSSVRRGGADATRVSAAARVAPLAKDSPRFSAAVQTDSLPVESAAFVREGGDGSHSPATVEYLREALSVSPPPAPSAIMARQYAEAVSEMESMRVRLDVAEREAQNLREMCVTQELRCDDLETQLLAKEEQLSRFAQVPAASSDGGAEASDGVAETAAACGPPPAELKALVTQLTDVLRSIQRVQREVVVNERDEDEAPRGEPAPLLLASSDSAVSKGPFTHEEDADETKDTVQLSSLVEQVSSAVLQISQQHAALQAELEVVRADRNELIGEQGEQVRRLQQQLLEKETEQLRLMQQLQSARDLAEVAIAGEKCATDTSKRSPPLAFAAPHRAEGVAQTDIAHEQRDGRGSADSGDKAALIEEVAHVKAQQAEAKAAAAAAMEAQRSVFTERLEQAQAELKDTRLRAEDEYDSFSSTIERLSRELADTREALRVKEVSLRIALRESSPALVLAAAAAVTPPSVSAVPRTSPLSEGSHHFVRTLSIKSPAASPLQLQSRPPESSTPAGVNGVGADDQRSDSPPSPLASPPPPLERASDAAATAARRLVSEGRISAEGSVFQPPLRREKFVDDGTLRSLPSLVPMEDGETAAVAGTEDDAAHFFMTNTTTTTIDSSRGKSSRGLTTSADGASHTTASLPREGSGGSAENHAALSHPALEGALFLGKEAVAGPERKGVSQSAETLKQTHPLFRSAADKTQCAPAVESIRQRKSASARIADRDGVGEEELPLPLPLRSPLFRGPPSPASSSPSPPQRQRPPSPPPVAETPWNVTTDVGLAARPLTGLPSRRPISFSPEERLRRFLASAADDATGDEGEATDEVSVYNSSRTATTARTGQVSALSATERLFGAAPPRGGPHYFGLEDGGGTPQRTPVSLLSERTPVSAGSTPSSGVGGSPRVSEVAARHTLASLRRHREVWQQQASLLQSLQSTPSS